MVTTIVKKGKNAFQAANAHRRIVVEVGVLTVTPNTAAHRRTFRTWEPANLAVVDSTLNVAISNTAPVEVMANA